MTPTPWVTPTPYPTPVATAGIQLALSNNHDLAVGLVQGYQMANGGGGLDWAIAFMMVALILGGMWSITKALQNG